MIAGPALAIFGVVLGLGWIWPRVATHFLLHPIRRDAARSRPSGFEPLEITAADGARIGVWFRRAKAPGRPLALVLHGIDDDRRFGVRIADLIQPIDANVLLVDLRGHGVSGGDACTYGQLERADVSAAISTVLDLEGSRIQPRVAVYGFSLGGAVALLTAAVDARITAVFSQSTFSDLRTSFSEYFQRVAGFRSELLVGLAIECAESSSPLRVSEVSPMTAVSSLRIPLVIAHGTADRNIPSYHAERLVEAARRAPRELYWVEGADHLDVWKVGGELYRRRVVDFFREALR